MTQFQVDCCGLPGAWWRSVVLGGIFLAAIAPMATAADAARSPSKLLPCSGLYLYLEYDGLAGHTAAWKATAAYDILGRTPVDGMLKQVTRQLFDDLFKMAPGRKFNGSELLAIGEHIFENGFAVAFYDDDGDRSTVLVLRAVEKNESKWVERTRRYVLMPDEAGPLPKSTSLRERNLFKFGDQPEPGKEREKQAPASAVEAVSFRGVGTDSAKRLTVWLEGNDLIVVQGPDDDLADRFLARGASTKNRATRHLERVTAVLDAIDGKQPSVSTHRAYQAASAQGRDLAGFEANGLFLVEETRTRKGMLSLLSLTEMGDKESLERVFLQTFGLHNARRAVGRWGFRGKALLTDIRFEAAEPWNRVGSMLYPSNLSKDRLPPLPAGAGAFAVGSFRQGDFREAIAPMWGVVKDDVRPILEAAEKALVDVTTRAYRDEMFRHVGPTWCIYASPSARPDANGSADPAFLVEVDDSDIAGKYLDEMISRANAYFRAQRPGNGPAALAFERLPAPDHGYRLISPARVVPWLTDQFQPAVLLGKSYLSIAASPGMARAAIGAETDGTKRVKPTDELAKSFDCLPAAISLLIVGNPRDSVWPEAIASFPTKASPFARMFVGLPPGNLPDEPPAADLLGLLGVPARPATQLQGGTAKLPAPEELRARIFPSVIAASVDEHNFRFIVLEALPFALVGPEVTFGEKMNVDIGFKFRPGK